MIFKRIISFFNCENLTIEKGHYTGFGEPGESKPISVPYPITRMTLQMTPETPNDADNSGNEQSKLPSLKDDTTTPDADVVRAALDAFRLIRIDGDGNYWPVDVMEFWEAHSASIDKALSRLLQEREMLAKALLDIEDKLKESRVWVKNWSGRELTLEEHAQAISLARRIMEGKND